MGQITAYGNKIIIQRLEGSSVSPGGIVLPKARNSNWANVVSVGPNGNQKLINKCSGS